jgi:hypothetical protein
MYSTFLERTVVLMRVNLLKPWSASGCALNLNAQGKKKILKQLGGTDFSQEMLFCIEHGES